MISFFINGMKCTPCAIADEKGNRVVTMSIEDGSAKKLEDFVRNSAVYFGLFVGLAFHPFSKQEMADNAVPYSISRAWRLGRAILKSRKDLTDPMTVMEEMENAKLIFRGKIIDLDRRIERGYNFGTIKISGFDAFKGCSLRIDFQNENLVAYLTREDGTSGYIASVPDLICIVDNERFQPLLCEDLKYGLRVAILVVPSVPLMITERALNVVGPHKFGYPDV